MLKLPPDASCEQAQHEQRSASSEVLRAGGGGGEWNRFFFLLYLSICLSIYMQMHVSMR